MKVDKDYAEGIESSENDQNDEEEYEPTQQEIFGYAEFLGMSLPDDADLLYIAEEGVSIFALYHNS